MSDGPTGEAPTYVSERGAFQQARHGRPQYLEALEAQVFQAVEREASVG